MEKPKNYSNILCSSSIQWNCGDDFIRFGTQHLLQPLLKKSTNWVCWNRNPDLFKKPWQDSRFNQKFLTNSAKRPMLDIMDYVLISGTPEWSGTPLKPIYCDILKYPDIPLLILGVGAGGPNSVFNKTELNAFRRPNTLIVTRSTDLADDINKTLGHRKAVPLPCPALFCYDWLISEHIDINKSKKTAIILQSSSVNNQCIRESTVQNILNVINNAEPYTIDIICFYIDEFECFSRIIKHQHVIYHFDAKNYVHIVKNYTYIYSTRLHGAVLALSCGVPAMLISDQNYRLSSTQALFGEFLPMIHSDKLSHHYLKNLEDKMTNGAFSQKVINFKKTVRQNYTTLLTPLLREQ